MDIKTVDSDKKIIQARERRLLLLIKKNITLRLAIQALIVVIMIYASWRYYGFYQYLQGFENGLLPYRPPVVEGFLPLAAIVAFKAMFVTGTIDPIHPAGLVIFISILITGFIFRRALCSWICPLGTLSEYLGKLGKKAMGRNLIIPKWLDVIFLIVKYVLLIYVLKDFIFLPATEAVNFMKLPYYTISDVKMFEMFLNIGIKGIAVISILMVLSFLFKSFWCRYLCPYGALIGILGIFSPFILMKNNDSCMKCGRCNNVCNGKVNIQDRKKLVVSTECTGCTSCVMVCPKQKTLELKLFGFLPVKPLVFSVCFIIVFYGIIVLGMVTGHWDSNSTTYDYKSIYQFMSSGFGGF